MHILYQNTHVVDLIFERFYRQLINVLSEFHCYIYKHFWQTQSFLNITYGQIIIQKTKNRTLLRLLQRLPYHYSKLPIYTIIYLLNARTLILTRPRYHIILGQVIGNTDNVANIVGYSIDSGPHDEAYPSVMVCSLATDPCCPGPLSSYQYTRTPTCAPYSWRGSSSFRSLDVDLRSVHLQKSAVQRYLRCTHCCL